MNMNIYLCHIARDVHVHNHTYLKRGDALFRKDGLLAANGTRDSETVRRDVVEETRLAKRVQTRQDLKRNKG